VTGFHCVNDPERGPFWQYAFGVKEFSRLLEKAGFTVERTFPYAILFGLFDLPLFGQLVARRAKAAAPCGGCAPHPSDGLPRKESASVAKRLLVTEDRAIPVLGVLVELAGRLVANMMMYVCSKAER
jgi:hypothetical protein